MKYFISIVRGSKRIAGILFLTIFSFYYVSVTFFPHTHVVDGVTIVHSHPFRSLPDKTPAHHDHSETAFILIHFLSTILIASTIVNAGILFIRSKPGVINKLFIEVFYFSPYFLTSINPRAPTA